MVPHLFNRKLTEKYVVYLAEESSSQKKIVCEEVLVTQEWM